MATIDARRAARSGSILAAVLAAVFFVLSFAAALAGYAEEPPAKAEAIPEFKPPPGFRSKKRGGLILYCRREAVVGTRFQTEKCYDEAGIRALKLADLEKTEMLERIRACGSSSCAAN